MLDARSLVGTHSVLFLTLDTLRFDVAEQLMKSGRTLNLQKLFGSWEPRHSPGSFTFAAHAAFFAGFLPTPIAPGPHPRLFALAFPGSETITPHTAVFEAPDIVSGFRQRGYRTICIGGTGFFNQLTPLGKVLPSLFCESHWSPALGVTDPHSTEHQVNVALERIAANPGLVFLFLNISAIHQPNAHYLGLEHDTLESHAAALEYVDGELGRLFDGLKGNWLIVACSDHGTCYGEDGYHGHRLAHPAVWTVPYAECVKACD